MNHRHKLLNTYRSRFAQKRMYTRIFIQYVRLYRILIKIRTCRQIIIKHPIITFQELYTLVFNFVHGDTRREMANIIGEVFKFSSRKHKNRVK
jgi:hypothetical protein